MNIYHWFFFSITEVAKEIIESNKGKGIAFPKPLCIQLPDPVYNTLCLMRTEGNLKYPIILFLTLWRNIKAEHRS